jgi:hypothetical protein
MTAKNVVILGETAVIASPDSSSYVQWLSRQAYTRDTPLDYELPVHNAKVRTLVLQEIIPHQEDLIYEGIKVDEIRTRFSSLSNRHGDIQIKRNGCDDIIITMELQYVCMLPAVDQWLDKIPELEQEIDVWKHKVRGFGDRLVEANKKKEDILAKLNKNIFTRILTRMMGIALPKKEKINE